MYKQSINQTKLVIIPLDGTIFDLNRYRYNYYHHMCEKYNKPISIHTFYLQLSNMYDMYKELPLSLKLDVGPMNSRIEREMLQYLTYKGIEPKEGFLELLEYLHQKNIPIAVISTHRTKDAVQYLKMANLYHKVHFIIGSDTSSMPLPSTQMLETVMQHFHVQNYETLVVSSFIALNKAANQLKLNVIYCEDLVQAGTPEKETSYKTVHNLFEVLNALLFDRYEEVEMYSPILGMKKGMNKDELKHVKQKLENTYQDDEQIMSLIDKTYAYHISQLQEQTIKDGSVFIKKTSSSQRFHFDDDLFDQQPTQDVTELTEEVIEEKKDIINKEEKTSESLHINPLDKQEEEELTTLLQQINRKKEVDTPIKKVTDFNEIQNIVENAQEEINEDDNEEESSLILNFCFNFIYTLAISFLVFFIGLIIYIAFIHQFKNNQGPFLILNTCFEYYYSFIETIYRFIIDGLHALLSFIPSYDIYTHQNHLFSPDGIVLFNIFIFQSVVIGVIKIIIYFIKRGYDNESIVE